MALAEGNPFETFGAAHVAAIGIVAAVAAGLTVWARRSPSVRVVRGIALALAAVLLVNEAVYYAAGAAVSTPAGFVQRFLPLHVCGGAVYLTAWMLVRPGRRVFEIAYVWGIGGTLQAILTPDLADGFPAYWFWQFFIAHGGIVAGVVFAAFALRLRPARGAALRVIVVTNLAVAAVGLADAALGANYMFLCAAPRGASPFFFLPWPWYILGLEAVGVAMTLLLFLPFAIARPARPRPRGAGALP